MKKRSFPLPKIHRQKSSPDRCAVEKTVAATDLHSWWDPSVVAGLELVAKRWLCMSSCIPLLVAPTPDRRHLAYQVGDEEGTHEKGRQFMVSVWGERARGGR
jgi:hypothetical protein